MTLIFCYEMLYGTLPEQYNEVLLVLDQKNSLPAETLYQLGMITREEYKEIVDAIENGQSAEEMVFDYKDVCDRTLYLVAACDYYIQNDNGTYSYIEDAVLNKDALLENAVELKVTGVVRPVDGASNANISTAIAYTEALTDHIIAHTAKSPVVLAQQKTPEINVLSGMKFGASTDEEKIDQTIEYIDKMEVSEKAQLYKLILYYSAGNSVGAEGKEPQEIETAVYDAAEPAMLPDDMQDGTGGMEWSQDMAEQAEGTAAGYGQMNMAAMDDNTMAMLLDKWLANDPDSQIMLGLYEQYIGNASYKDNMTAFGSVSYDAPASISIYADNFEDKEAIARCIQEYNAGVDEESRISYTDYVAMMTSSLTTIINGISYVLVAFVAISLIVSCIMIGIITHISVMERTKEIGILRALGASKGNISQVFNAETFIIGCFSGMVGIGITLLLLIPINSIITRISGIENLSAKLPVSSAAILIFVSIVITMIGGLLPAKKAAGKDPVIALRTE